MRGRGWEELVRQAAGAHGMIANESDSRMGRNQAMSTWLRHTWHARWLVSWTLISTRQPMSIESSGTTRARAYSAAAESKRAVSFSASPEPRVPLAAFFAPILQELQREHLPDDFMVRMKILVRIGVTRWRH